MIVFTSAIETVDLCPSGRRKKYLYQIWLSYWIDIERILTLQFLRIFLFLPDAGLELVELSSRKWPEDSFFIH